MNRIAKYLDRPGDGCPLGNPKSSDVAARYPAVVSALTGGSYRAERKGITFRCPFGDRHKRGDRDASARIFIGHRGECVCLCLGCHAKWREFVALSNLPPQEFWPEVTRFGTRTVAAQPTPKAVARYVYRHADGTEYGTKTRWEPGHHGRRKTFSWSRPVPSDIRLLCGIPDTDPAVIDGKDAMSEGWFVAHKWADGWHLRATEQQTDAAVLIPAAGPAPLFGLPELIAADPARLVWVVEGEKTKQALEALGCLAVNPPNGSNTWLPQYAGYFAGRDVVLASDNDFAGRSLMEVVAGQLLTRGTPRSVRTFESGVGDYSLPEGGDVADWLAAQRGKLKGPALRRALWELVQLCPVYRREVRERPA